MKKLIMVLAISLFAMALVCAAENTTELTTNGSETVTITLDTKAITGSSVAVGFSTAAVTGFNDGITHPDDEIVLTLESGRVATAALTTSDSINGAYHVYWKIASANPVTVTLEVSDLTKTDSSGTGPTFIPLSLAVGTDTLESTSSIAAGGIKRSFNVITTKASTGTTVGSYELKDITTSAINVTSSGTYTATLTLSVSIT